MATAASANKRKSAPKKVAKPLPKITKFLKEKNDDLTPPNKVVKTRKGIQSELDLKENQVILMA